MKKSLIALAAALGASGCLLAGAPAMAQSSVTLYGVADVAVGQQKTRDPNVGSHIAGIGMLSSEAMNNGNSRLGVRGVEDLGQGLKVGFNFSSGLSLNNGFAGTSNTKGNFWGRQANVWIEQQGLGRLSLGRNYTPSFLVSGVWELTDFYANYSVVGATYGFGGQNGAFSGDVNSISRSNSEFLYETPTIAGFKGYGAYVTHADNEGRKGGAWDLGTTYINGPLSVGVNASKVGSKHSGRMSYAAGAQYRFLGHFRAAASFNATPDGRRGFEYGGTYYTGPYSLTLDFTTDVNKASAHVDGSGTFVAAQRKKRVNAMVEGKYELSKQTFLYASYLYFDASNNWGLGMRHNF